MFIEWLLALRALLPQGCLLSASSPVARDHWGIFELISNLPARALRSFPSSLPRASRVLASSPALTPGKACEGGRFILKRVRFVVMIRMRISYQSLGSWNIKGTDKSTLEKDSSVNLMSHDPSDLGSLILFRIICLRNALFKLPLLGSRFGGFLSVCKSFL